MSITAPTHTDWIQTYTGKQFWPLAQREADICVEDIAHALSNLCRYAGHCEQFYSVAQHSVLVSVYCDPADALHGLLHDASEAYLIDMPRPIKRSIGMEAYRDAEGHLQRLIFQRFGLHPDEPPSVKRADNALLRTEQRDLMKPAPVEWQDNREGALSLKIVPMAPGVAERLFLARFCELTGAQLGEHKLTCAVCGKQDYGSAGHWQHGGSDWWACSMKCWRAKTSE
jgi:hypothetical protein